MVLNSCEYIEGSTQMSKLLGINLELIITYSQ